MNVACTERVTAGVTVVNGVTMPARARAESLGVSGQDDARRKSHNEQHKRRMHVRDFSEKMSRNCLQSQTHGFDGPGFLGKLRL